MEAWFLHRYPQRLQDELLALEAGGYEYILDENERKAGRIVITVKYPIEDEVHELSVIFPENYPYFPFEITSNSFPGGRHKDPYTGTLCLLKDPQKNWSVEDTLASILSSQVVKIVAAHKSPGEAGDLEAHEAAQITGQMRYSPASFVFVGDWKIKKECNHGYISIGLEGNLDPNKILRGAVLEVQEKNRTPLEAIDGVFRTRYPEVITGRWVRLPDAPSSTEPELIIKEAIAKWPDLNIPNFKNGPDVVGILIPEEVQYGQYHENWIFIVRVKTHSTRSTINFAYHLVRSDQASIETIRARTPKLSPIGDKKILVVGLGSLGSVFAWQMARAGIGSLNLLDFDHLQLGNIPRWMYGCGAVGHSKAQILSILLQQEYPFVKTTCIPHRIGGIKTPENPSDLDILPPALDGVDMIVDATAEWCVSHFLSDLARKKGIHYVWATATPGGWGGTIGRIAPGHTHGCWKCYQLCLTDGTIKRPNQEDIPDVQPAGCFHPTFTGTGFDLDHVTIEAVRLAVSTLCQGFEAAYPDFDWDVGIVDLFGDDGKPIAPKWHPYKLEKHPECDCHG